jgi:hypothetical protein
VSLGDELTGSGHDKQIIERVSQTFAVGTKGCGG